MSDIWQTIQTVAEANDGSFTTRDAPNEVTAAAIEEGRRLASDRSVKGYTSMEELKAALEA